MNENDTMTIHTKSSSPLGGRGALIGAATSNNGKTTLTMGLLRALRKRGLRVQPYKCGPDYIDTMFHEISAGRESVNLDTFMSSQEHVRQLFSHYSHDADISVVEGVMGLFDGYNKDKGSSAEIARILNLPVILVVNAKSVAYSVAPLIYGFKHFCPNTQHPTLGTNVAGVIFNMVASENHYSFLKAACEDAGVPCLGYLPRNEHLVIPNRHLGLTITARKETEQLIALAAEEVEKHVDLDKFLQLTVNNEQLTINQTTKQPNNQTTIAIAKDEAFNFTYRANIDAMSAEGDVVFFSPMRDNALPNCDILYLPGGYPELFADQLMANASMRKSIYNFVQQNGKVFAECGGFMYLCQDIDGKEMCGVLPLHATMQEAKLHLGYRQLTKQPNNQTTKQPKGHEFHYSHILPNEKMPDDITIIEHQSSAQGRSVNTAVYRYKNVIAGYTHWYWAETGFTTFLKNI